MKNLFFILTFLCSVYFYGQEKDEIKPLVDSLISYSINQEFDKVMDSTYPKLFDMVDRNQITELLNQMMQNDEYKIEFHNIAPKIQIDYFKIIDTNKYALVTYKAFLSFTYQDIEDLNIDLMLGLIQTSYPNGDVVWNGDKNRFEIKTRLKIIAISDDLTNGKWKFLNANTEDRALLHLLLNEKIIKEFEL